jgi:hypothetical protein
MADAIATIIGKLSENTDSLARMDRLVLEMQNFNKKMINTRKKITTLEKMIDAYLKYTFDRIRTIEEILKSNLNIEFENINPPKVRGEKPKKKKHTKHRDDGDTEDEEYQVNSGSEKRSDDSDTADNFLRNIQRNSD